MYRLLSAACLLILSLTAQSATAASVFWGEFWDVSGNVRNMGQADAVIAGNAPTATFTSTLIDYPQGAQNTVRANTTTLDQFLGGDAGTISGPSTATLTNTVFRWTGYVDLLPGVQTFTVQSDDGFRLTIDGNVVAERTGRRGFRGTTETVNAGVGRVAVELIFFESGGSTGVEFYIDGQYAQPVSVPVPGGLPLMAAGLGGLVLLRRKMN